LVAVGFFLFSDVAPDRFFIIANRTGTIASGPERQTGHSFLAQQLSMYPYRTLPFPVSGSDYMRYAILGWDAQAEVNVISDFVSWQQLIKTMSHGSDPPFLLPFSPSRIRPPAP
jgi:hypothetical protein